MTEQKKVDCEGAGASETSHIAADPAPARRRRLTAADVSSWRDAFLEGGASNLKQRPRDARDEEIDCLRAKVGEITMDNELLYEKISKMEAGHPFARRRSKR